ncbi:MAG: DUF302 domain-containing protein [Thiohalomonadaceae bacterium]|jgi:uncharacterized protein (DUF302 family)
MRCLSASWPALLLLFALHSTALADGLMMVRSEQGFPETMAILQEEITQRGYTISRIQRVDVGLTDSGFKTDMYRLVFLAKPEELRDLTTRYPQLIPYLPWPITVFAEDHETLLVTANPTELRALANNNELKEIFARWSQDFHDILEAVRKEN